MAFHGVSYFSSLFNRHLCATCVYGLDQQSLCQALDRQRIAEVASERRKRSGAASSRRRFSAPATSRARVAG